MQRSELTKLELYKEDGCYYLRAEYEEEDDYRLRKYTIPKILLPLGSNITVNHISEPVGRLAWRERNSIDFGFGELDIFKCDDGYYYKCETIKEYPQKMTLEEIEKKLGYKVELVSGK